MQLQDPTELEDWLGDLNPRSMEIIKDAYAVPALASAPVGAKFQFERIGECHRSVQKWSTQKGLQNEPCL